MLLPFPSYSAKPVILAVPSISTLRSRGVRIPIDYLDEEVRFGIWNNSFLFIP